MRAEGNSDGKVVTLATSDRAANREQVDYWNAAPGRKWVTYQPGIDTTFLPVNRCLLNRARPQPGERVMDIGCGTGATTMDFAAALGPGGDVTGIDLSRPLLDHAICRRDGRRDKDRLAPIDFRLADAQTDDVDGLGCDLVFSRFGVMFFEDPVGAFRNILSALRPGGRIVFVSWAKLAGNPWFEVPRNAAVARLGRPEPTDPTAPGPLAFQDRTRVADILARAGFEDIVAEEERIHLFNPGRVSEVAGLASNIGPAARIVKEFDGGPQDVEAIRQMVADAFQVYATEYGMRIPANLNFFEATRPH